MFFIKRLVFSVDTWYDIIIKIIMGKNGVFLCFSSRLKANDLESIRKGMNNMAENGHKTTAELRQLLKDSMTTHGVLSPEGRLTAHERMNLFFDEGTFVEVGAYIGRKRTELDSEADDSFEPVVTGYGAVDGTLVYVFSQDFSRLHGALGEMHAKKIVKIVEMAARSGAPLVGIFDSAGAKILEGVDSLAGYGSIMRAIGTAPITKIAVVCGPCGGAGSVIAELFDLLIGAKKTGKLFVSPSGKKADGISAKESLVDIVCEDDAAAVTKARIACSYFTGTHPQSDDINRIVALDGILSQDVYDVHAVIDTVFDAGSFMETGAEYAGSMVTGFAAIGGRVVGIVANNPATKGGLLCPCAADKAARLLSVCRGAALPVVTLVDTDGIADKAHAEEMGFAAKLSGLAAAYVNLTAPAVTVTLGKSYGTAHTVMGSKALTGGVALALDRAKISAMSPDSAVEFLGEVDDESRHSEIAARWAQTYASPLEAAKSGHIDDIIDAAELRQRIGAALEMLCF